MPVNLAQYRVTVGIFNNRQIIVSLHYEASLYSGMLICDVEMNPGPLIAKNIFQSATGISTVYLPMTSLNYFF